MLIHCPLCSSGITEQILSQYKVIVRKEGEAEVGALATFRCSRGHVFFVRLMDLARPETVAGEAYELPFGSH